MFEGFFYALRAQGVPVDPTGFLRLQRALSEGLVLVLDDLYAVARALLVKRERHFDIYDRLFAHTFQGVALPEDWSATLSADLEAVLRQWLADPAALADLPADVQDAIQGMTPEEVLAYFRERLADQTEAHHGGNRWIGTGGTSPVGHSGHHPGGMRVGGQGRSRSAIKVALDRRYVDYAEDGPLTERQLGEALRALRHLTPSGPRDRLDVEASIRQTVRQGGEIELVFDRRWVDRLNVFLLLDNGGWSMSPYVPLTRALFGQARDAFRRLRTFYFHNTVYDQVWEDPRRHQRSVRVEDLLREDPETRLVFVGDASMAPWELFHDQGALDWTTQQRRPSIRTLEALAERFPARVWINPIPRRWWARSGGGPTIRAIRDVVPMVDLSLPGIEEAVRLLQRP